MKKSIIFLTAFCAVCIYAAQDASLSIRQVRDPVQLQAKLNANAADAESRLIAAAITNGIATMEGGATLDNTTSAAELNITETTVKITGALTATGTTTLKTTLTGALKATAGVISAVTGLTTTNSFVIGSQTNTVIVLGGIITAWTQTP
jgi:hypothetical protein